MMTSHLSDVYFSSPSFNLIHIVPFFEVLSMLISSVILRLQFRPYTNLINPSVKKDSLSSYLNFFIFTEIVLARKSKKGKSFSNK
ncbi:hypothetical protein BpHYR1_024671 [Brachionus plicatilis]|uniref:Uncharacterized protein n=1 Tax=Brachionus plicatilis TaxID=10195 RepID=A0A3M7QV10_BRAPC|nr:hypothetical protein BpHYR1_024671 [Brachionus plicatilis]